MQLQLRALLLAALIALIPAGSRAGGPVNPPPPGNVTCTGGQGVTAIQGGQATPCGAFTATATINSGGPQAITIYNASGVTVSPGTLASYLTLSGSQLAISALPNAQLANSSVTINTHSLSLGGTLTLGFPDFAGQLASTQMPAYSGDVVSAAGATVNTIANNAVSNAKMAVGAAVANIGYTPLNPVNNLADVASTATTWNNLGGGALGKLAVPNPGIVVSGGASLAPLGIGNNLTLSGTYPNQTLNAAVTQAQGLPGQVQYNAGGTPASFAGLTNTQLTGNIQVYTSALSGAVPPPGTSNHTQILWDNGWGIPPAGGGGGISGPGVTTPGYVPTWANTVGTALNTGLAVANTGPSALVQLNAAGLMLAPVSTTTGAFTGTLSVGGALTFTGLSSGTVVNSLGLNSNNQVVLGPPGGGGGAGTVNNCTTFPSVAYYAAAGTAVSCLTNGTANGQVLTWSTSGPPSFQAALSGMSSGQLAVAGSATTITSSLPVNTTGVNTVLTTDAAGNEKSPISTTTGAFSGALSVGGAISATGLAAGTVTQWIGLNASNQFVLGTPASGSGTVNNCTTAFSTAYYAATGTAVSCLASVGTAGQVLTSGGAGVAPSFQAPVGGLSNQTAGLIPVASSATTANGSTNAPLAFSTGQTNNALVQLDGAGHINPAVIPNTTVSPQNGVVNPLISVGADGRLIALSPCSGGGCPMTNFTLNPGLTSNASVYNTGTQNIANGGTLSIQAWVRTISTAGTFPLAATDGAYLNMPTVAGVTVQLPAPGAIGTSSFSTISDANHSYSVSSAAGQIYGCGFNLTATLPAITWDAQFVTDGTNWVCLNGPVAPLVSTNPSAHTVTGGEWNSAAVFRFTTAGLTLTLPAAVTLATNGGVHIQTVGVTVQLAPTAASGDAIDNGQVGGGAANAAITIPADIDTYVTTSGVTGTGAFLVPLGPAQYFDLTWGSGQNLSAAAVGISFGRWATPRVITGVTCRPDVLVGGTATIDIYTAASAVAFNSGSAYKVNSTSCNANSGAATEQAMGVAYPAIPSGYWVGAIATGAGWASSTGWGTVQVTYR